MVSPADLDLAGKACCQDVALSCTTRATLSPSPDCVSSLRMAWSAAIESPNSLGSGRLSGLGLLIFARSSFDFGLLANWAIWTFGKMRETVVDLGRWYLAILVFGFGLGF